MINFVIAFFEIICAILFPLGQLGRISFLNQQISIYPYEVFMVLSLLVFIFKYRRDIFIHMRGKRVILLFFVSLFVSFVLTASSYSLFENTVGFMYFIRLIFYFVHFMYLSLHISLNLTYRSLIRYELFFLTGIVIISSWLQYFYYPNLKNLLYMGWDPHLYRVFGFFFEPYLAGCALGLLMFFLYFSWNPNKKIRYVKWAVLLNLFVLILLTFSRTVYIALLTTAFYWFVREKKPIYLAGFAVLFFTVVFIIPKPEGAGVQLLRTFTINTRVSNAREGLQVWIKSPVFGIGYNRTRYVKDGVDRSQILSHAAANYHSSFITILATGGLAGFVFFCLVLFSFFRISQATHLYVIFISLISLGDNALLHPFMMFIYFRLIAMEKEKTQSSLM